MFRHLDIPNLSELEVKESATGKRFYKTPEGLWYPSITTILGMEEKPWLKNWQKMLGKKKADKEQKRCADRGTAIHSMAEKYLNNEKLLLSKYKQEYVSDFNKLKIRLNSVDNIRGQELPLYSDTLKVAGRVDCVGEYEGKLAIIDFKTSTNNKYREWIADYFLQTTAYAIMWHERTGEPIENIVILMSVERGMVSLMFKDKIDDHIAPLLKRIRECKNGLQKSRRAK
jgi:genome maintenance exonuclease 1